VTSTARCSCDGVRNYLGTASICCGQQDMPTPLDPNPGAPPPPPPPPQHAPPHADDVCCELALPHPVRAVRHKDAAAQQRPQVLVRGGAPGAAWVAVAARHTAAVPQQPARTCATALHAPSQPPPQLLPARCVACGPRITWRMIVFWYVARRAFSTCSRQAGSVTTSLVGWKGRLMANVRPSPTR
jgi:hypothetical protein